VRWGNSYEKGCFNFLPNDNILTVSMLISSITTYTSLTALLATGSKHQLFPEIRLEGPKLPWSEEFDWLWLT